MEENLNGGTTAGATQVAIEFRMSNEAFDNLTNTIQNVVTGILTHKNLTERAEHLVDRAKLQGRIEKLEESEKGYERLKEQVFKGMSILEEVLECKCKQYEETETDDSNEPKDSDNPCNDCNDCKDELKNPETKADDGE